MRNRARTLLLSLLLPLASAAMAGGVEVAFVNARSFTDAGNSNWEQDANLLVLARHLQDLGQRLLPANQVLKVKVLDVDLAGTVRTLGHGLGDVRFMQEAADYPRIHLKYSLEADGAVRASGEEWVIDLNYARSLRHRPDAEPLRYERLMLDQWFRARFVEGQPAPG